MSRKKPEVAYPQPHRIFRSTVLMYLERDGEVLLLHRNRRKNLINEGLWNGVITRRIPREYAVKAMRRTIPDATGVTPTKWKFHGLIELYYTVPRYLYERVYVFTATEWEGELQTERPDGELKWVKKERLPKLKMWRADRLALKALGEGRRFFHLMMEYAPDGELTDAVVNCHRVPLEEWDV